MKSLKVHKEAWSCGIAFLMFVLWHQTGSLFASNVSKVFFGKFNQNYNLY